MNDLLSRIDDMTQAFADLMREVRDVVTKDEYEKSMLTARVDECHRLLAQFAPKPAAASRTSSAVIELETLEQPTHPPYQFAPRVENPRKPVSIKQRVCAGCSAPFMGRKTKHYCDGCISRRASDRIRATVHGQKVGRP